MSGVSTPDPVREAFEHWFSEGGKHPKAVERQGEGYRLAHGQSSWNAWKAAHAALSHPAVPLRPAAPPFDEFGRIVQEVRPDPAMAGNLAAWCEWVRNTLYPPVAHLITPLRLEACDAAASEVLIAIKRPDDYDDVAPELVAEDFVEVRGNGFEWRVVEPSPAPAPHATQEATRQDERDAAHERMRHAGTMLSNCAFNLAQSDTLDEPTKKTLDKCRREWDEALRAAMSSTPGAQP